MCTVTFIARQRGYCLGMNRDENLTRPTGLPPKVKMVNGCAVISPSEPGGGTWIAVNDHGATLALINWYSVTARAAGQTVSRGGIVKLALPSDSSALVDAALAESSLARVNPFRLIGVFPAQLQFGRNPDVLLYYSLRRSCNCDDRINHDDRA